MHCLNGKSYLTRQHLPSVCSLLPVELLGCLRVQHMQMHDALPCTCLIKWPAGLGRYLLEELFTLLKAPGVSCQPLVLRPQPRQVVIQRLLGLCASLVSLFRSAQC